MSDLFKDEVVRALSWKQPFGSLMLHGKLETRTNKTNIRGKVLICTTAAPYKISELNSMSTEKMLEQAGEILQKDTTKFLHGYAIAIGDLVNCRLMQPSDEPLAFVKHRTELWVWEFNNVQRINPFAWKGAQGWKILTNQQKQLIEYAQ